MDFDGIDRKLVAGVEALCAKRRREMADTDRVFAHPRVMRLVDVIPHMNVPGSRLGRLGNQIKCAGPRSRLRLAWDHPYTTPLRAAQYVAVFHRVALGRLLERIGGRPRHPEQNLDPEGLLAEPPDDGMQLPPPPQFDVTALVAAAAAPPRPLPLEATAA